ncbi:hypothetical protein ONE63_006227 [Megalurothrips usitatus]|uniref:Uncharacterized protein n=1 Tax=Megalurothrips usitatus TaxID=439358 RepID=A0AAV7XW42_9NEOP|nr:hypothetical protein ONE63_006227 [Megalurothrips usitatus]
MLLRREGQRCAAVVLILKLLPFPRLRPVRVLGVGAEPGEGGRPRVRPPRPRTRGLRRWRRPEGVQLPHVRQDLPARRLAAQAPQVRVRQGAAVPVPALPAPLQAARQPQEARPRTAHEAKARRGRGGRGCGGRGRGPGLAPPPFLNCVVVALRLENKIAIITRPLTQTGLLALEPEPQESL